MILRRFYDYNLAQASYLVGCEATGEALVVDPSRDLEPYLDAARRERLRITHVTETHIHADFVSGSRELADRAGARLHLSDEGGEGWRYAYAADAGAELLHDGDSFRVGQVRIDVLHTPGHTPEHLSFLVTDTATADRPMGVFTGDFVFVGDVGRPDLLERAAKHSGTMEASARSLFRSLQRFRTALPDYVQIWPGHGAGSACGKALGAVPQSTVGYEKLFNWALAQDDEEEFVRSVLAGQPEPPMYFAEMKRVNREGPRILGEPPRPARLPADRLPELVGSDALVVDARRAPDYAAAHLPDTVSVPLGGSFTTWAGSVLPYDRDLYLILPDGDRTAARTALDLAMIGLDRVCGYFGADAVDAWTVAGHPTQRVPEVAPDGLQEGVAGGELEVVDVRSAAEYAAGHIPGSRNLPLGRLPERLGEIPRGRRLVVHCQSGARAGVAIGLLQAAGFDDVGHLTGDFGGWRSGGREVATEAD